MAPAAPGDKADLLPANKSGFGTSLTTFATDHSRPTLLIDVEFTSLDGQPYQVYAVYQPQLNNPAAEAPLNQSGVTEGNALLRSDAQMQVVSALVASPAG